MKPFRQLMKPLSQPSIFFPSTHTDKPIMTIKGNEQIIIENVYTLEHFSKEKIIIKSGNNTINMTEKNLILQEMLKDEFLIKGELYDITFELRKGGAIKYQQAKVIVGYVTIHIKGKHPEQFFKQSTTNNITVMNVRKIAQDICMGTIYLHDLKNV